MKEKNDTFQQAFSKAQRPLIVAEIGNNHEGSFELAQELVRQAGACGVDAVKFQTFLPERYYHKDHHQRLAKLRGFALSPDHYHELKGLSDELGLFFISTPFDLESAHFLQGLVDAFKISSGDNTYLQLIEWVAAQEQPFIMSTGCSSYADLKVAGEVIRKVRPLDGLTCLLHCVSSYPTPPEAANLKAITELRARFSEYEIGYSDHTIGVNAAVAATAMGATLIEKHFTIDKAYSDFRDHQLSADPEEMKRLVVEVQEVATLMGEGTREVQECEEPVAPQIRRSAIVTANLPEGHALGSTDLAWVRPAGGIPPQEMEKLLGCTLKRSLEEGDHLSWEDLE